MPDIDSFGPFARLFALNPGYMALGHMDRDASAPLRVITDLVRTVPLDGDKNIRELISDPNWRTQLFGTVAALVSPEPACFVASLWESMDGGSWVSPQLAVVLFHSDPAFVTHAKHRVSTGSPLRERNSSMDWLDRLLGGVFWHVESGPASATERSAKNVAALLQLLESIPSERVWAQTERLKPEVAALLALERDLSGEIAASWQVGLRECFQEIGVPLSEPTA